MIYTIKNKIRMWIAILGIVACAVSSYSEGLPGEFLVSQVWRDAMAAKAPLTNPAFLSRAEYVGVQLAQAFTVANSFQISEGFFVLPYHKHTFALSYYGLGAGDIDGTVWNGSDVVATGTKESERSNSFLLSYAINPINRLSIGINGHLAYNSLFGKKLMGYGADIGVSYAIVDDSVKGSHVLGLSTQNILMLGDRKYASAATLSYLGRMFENLLEAEFYLTMKDFLAQTEDFASGEDKGLEFDVAFKAGVWLFNALKIYGQVGNEYWGFSGGVSIPSINKGRDLSILYQYIMPFEGEYPSHTIFARSEFGQPRKEKAAKAAKEKISGIPYDLYNKAMKLYSDGQYWDAYFVFAKILVEYPRFIKNDYISYYSGNCLEKLDIRDVAAAQYQRAMIKYPKSKIHPLANMGIMNIYYRQDNTSGVEDQFKLLSGPHTVDSLRYHAHYLRGETYFKEKNYQAAIDILSKVPVTHADYMFARHTMAVAAVMQDNYQNALAYLKDILSDTTNSKADEEITNRTYLFTGYIFHEEKEFQNAIASLSMVPKTSYYYEDALLGICWISLRVKKYDECMSAAQNLVSIASSDVNKAEGELIQGYVHMMRKEYNEASNLLQTASGRVISFSEPSQGELDSKTTGYQTIRNDYESFGKSVEEIAQHKQDTDTIAAIDSMFIDQKEFKREIDEKVEYFDSFRRQSYFARNINVVREDVEYALARVLKTISQKDMMKIQEKNEKKEDKLDKEIEELKKQIENKSK